MSVQGYREMRTSRQVWVAFASMLLSLVTAAPASPQTPVGDAAAAVTALGVQLEQVRQTVEAMRAELAEARRDTQDARAQVAALRAELEAVRRDGAPPSVAGAAAAPLEDQELLAAKVNELEQTKVESASKYHLRLSGTLLVNLLGVRGSVDALDVPRVVTGSDTAGGAFAGSLRQSSIGLSLFGPTLAGARASGEVVFDFAGGFPDTTDGLSAGLMRLRTASMRADWTNGSIVAGQETIFFSPRSPSSLASAAYPALSSAGNLWAWTPQVYAERRVRTSPPTADPGGAALVLQGGILDPLTGEAPASEYQRLPTAGERSRTPAAAFRVGGRRNADDLTSEVAVGGYVSRQDWGLSTTTRAWAFTSDWDLWLGPHVGVSGELYRGRAIAGLGGGGAASVQAVAPPAGQTTSSAVVPIDSTGGWVQLKLKSTPRLEFNTAFGRDHSVWPGGAPITAATLPEPFLTSNASLFVNTIYQARSNILFSIEYRRLWTTALGFSSRAADHISLTSGLAF